jgi:hypothetical protein
MVGIANAEAHAGAGDVGEGFKAPQNEGDRYDQGKEGASCLCLKSLLLNINKSAGKEHSHNLLDKTDERSLANNVRTSPQLPSKSHR